jgi:type VI secretion system protein ImpM
VTAGIGDIGWYGKVASLGDFTLRGLPPEFVQPWDTWLQQGMRDSRMRLGKDWTGLYLQAPVWRFALAPGVCGRASVAGVVLPGVDRVGRHFPLTVAAMPDDGAALHGLVDAGAAWFDALAALGVDAMRGALPLADLGIALAALAPPALGHAPGPEPEVAWVALDAGQAAAAALSRMLPVSGLAGRAVFWTEGTPHMAPTLLVSAGLPPAGRFGAMLGAPRDATGPGR